MESGELPKSESVYDRIGRGYGCGRRADPRWAAAIREAIGEATSVLNVGAGTGSYEPTDVDVVAVEPSGVMIHQRTSDAAPVVQARAEALPFDDGSFDVAMAVLTVHHWSDWRQGIAELRRVADRQVLVVFDTEVTRRFWLVDDYLPEAAVLDDGRSPPIGDLRAALPRSVVLSLAVPADMRDGVLAAHWARPEAYLDPDVRANASTFRQLPAVVVNRAIASLRSDLEDGGWDRRYGRLRTGVSYDAGYRLVVSE